MDQQIKVKKEINEQNISVKREPVLLNVTGTLKVTNDGIYDVKQYANVDVDVVDGEIDITDEGNFDVTHFETAKVKTTHGQIEITQNGVADVRQYESANVTVGSDKVYGENDINFYDYDGTIIYSCTLEKAHSLTSLPIPPAHEGLIFQEWNYSLEEINATTHILDVGAIYDTYEVRTDIINGVETTYVAHPVRLYLDIPIDNCTIYTMFGINYGASSTDKVNRALINWGDGSEESASTTNNVDYYGGYKDSHTYEKAGKYVLQFFCHPNNLQLIDGEYVPIKTLFNTPNVRNYLLCNSSGEDTGVTSWLYVTKLEFGSLHTTTQQNNYINMPAYNVKSVTLSNKTFFGRTWYDFEFARGCKHLNLPKGTPTIQRGGFANSALKSISLPNTITTLEYGSFSGAKLNRLVIPDSVTTIEGQYNGGSSNYYSTFYISAGLTSYVSSMCYGYAMDKLLRTTDVSSFGDSCFRQSNITEFTFERDVTSTLSQTFYNCIYLTKVIFKGEVSSIDVNCFNGCKSLLIVDLSNVTTVPTLSSSTAFSNVPSVCKIYVPSALLNDFKTAANWSALESQFVGV